METQGDWKQCKKILPDHKMQRCVTDECISVVPEISQGPELS